MTRKDLKLLIREAGNTHNPALIVLREKGYSLWIEPDQDEESEYTDWRAEKNDRQFSATDPNVLLGLVAMQEWRGDSWQCKVVEPDISDELFSKAYPDKE